jgi:hypothetical protein
MTFRQPIEKKEASLHIVGGSDLSLRKIKIVLGIFRLHMVCRSAEKGWSQARGVVEMEAVLNTQKRYQEQVTIAKYTETPQKVVLIQQLTETTFFY